MLEKRHISIPFLESNSQDILKNRIPRLVFVTHGIMGIILGIMGNDPFLNGAIATTLTIIGTSTIYLKASYTPYVIGCILVAYIILFGYITCNIDLCTIVFIIDSFALIFILNFRIHLFLLVVTLIWLCFLYFITDGEHSFIKRIVDSEPMTLSIPFIILFVNAYICWILSGMMTAILSFTKEKQVKDKVTEKNIKRAIGLIEEEMPHLEIGLHKKDMLHVLDCIKKGLLELKATKNKASYVKEGLSKINSILRTDEFSIEEMSDMLLKELIKFTGANQGCLFIVHKKEKTEILKMCATYAYGRKKFLNRELDPGEGLVGQVYMEQETTYLKEVPEDYVEISSGLGHAKPQNIIIVPIKDKVSVTGVLEIASFENFEEQHIDFYHSAVNEMATTFRILKSYQTTKSLLEESQKKSKLLEAKENELTIRLTELKHEKKRTETRERRMGSILEAVDNSGLIMLEYDIRGRLVSANDHYYKKTKASADKVKGKHFSELIGKAQARSDTFKRAWAELSTGKSFTEEIELVCYGSKRLLTRSSFSIIRDNGGAVGFLQLGSDISSIKKLLEEITVKYMEEMSEKESEYNNKIKELEKKLMKILP